MEKILLIDGHSIINRAFYGVPDLTNSQGLHTNGIYGFLNIILKIMDEEKPDYVTVAFDLKAPTFRHLMYEGYKGTRKGMPEELREQVPVLKEVLASMGIVTVSREGYEADDILGTIAKKAEKEGMDVILLSGDRDLLQIASDKIMIMIPKTKKGGTEIEKYYTKDVIDLYGVTPTEFIDMKALMGDSSDNIPGVPGIGEKTAGALIQKFHSIEAIKEHMDEVSPKRAKTALENNFDMAVMSKVLATIKTDCELDYSFEAARLSDIYNEKFYEFVMKLEFKSIAQRFAKSLVMDNGGKKVDWDYVLMENEEALEEAKKALSEVDIIAFKFFHDAPDVMTAGNIIYGFVAAAGKIYACKDAALLKKLAFMITGLSAKKLTVELKKALMALYENGEVREEEYEDLSLMAYLLNPLKDSYDYDDLSRDYLDSPIPAKKDLLGKDSMEKAVKSQPEAVRKLAMLYAPVLFDAYPVLTKKLSENGMDKLYSDMELPLAFTLHSMEKYGIRADKTALKEYGEKLTVMIDQLEKEIYTEAGENFNINSPKQLGVILFEKLGLPSGKKTKTGYSTAADVLEKLKPDYPIVGKILEYRTVSKLKSTYADGLAAYIKEDGRIHGNFNQTITATGRISSTEPNLQNIPARMELGREIRKIFIPEDGYVFVDADYSQIELRVLASMSQDENLINAYNSAADIHAITASQVFHVPLSEVTPELRRNAKAVNFGIVYGISAFGLSEDLSISRKEAQSYMDRYFITYPGIHLFLDKLVEDARKEEVTKTLFGRIRPVPELKSSNFMQRSFGERIAMNAPIQGTAADIIKIAMIRVDRRLKKECKLSRLLLQIHDELLIEAHESEKELVKIILKEEMENAASLSVTLEVSMEEGKSWYETK